MAASTSGTINSVVFTRDQIIKDALGDLRVLSAGVPPTAEDLVVCTMKLNILLRKWAIKGTMLWCRDTLQITCVANKRSYTIGPVGADVTSYRPLRVFDSSFVRYVSSGQNYDTGLRVLSRSEYKTMGSKGALGIANSIYYDPQMTSTPNVAYQPSMAMGILHMYTTPIDATRTVHLDVQRPIQDISSPSDTFDLPLEWYDALTKNLAAEVCDKYEVPEPRLVRIKQQAAQALEDVADWGGTEWTPLTFEPEFMGWR